MESELQVQWFRTFFANFTAFLPITLLEEQILNKPVKLTALGFCKTEVKLGSKRKIFIRTFKENGNIETAYLHYYILKTEKKKGGNQGRLYID